MTEFSGTDDEWARLDAEQRKMWVDLKVRCEESERQYQEYHQNKLQAALSPPPPPPPRIEPTHPAPRETAEARNERRYQMCIDAGLKMPADDYAHLPVGIRTLAEREGITKQAFSKSVKSHIAASRR